MSACRSALAALHRRGRDGRSALAALRAAARERLGAAAARAAWSNRRTNALRRDALNRWRGSLAKRRRRRARTARKEDAAAIDMARLRAARALATWRSMAGAKRRHRVASLPSLAPIFRAWRRATVRRNRARTPPPADPSRGYRDDLYVLDSLEPPPPPVARSPRSPHIVDLVTLHEFHDQFGGLSR